MQTRSLPDREYEMTKEELIAKMLGSMQSPVTKFAGVLSATLRSVVLALNAVAEKKAAQEG